ncbi:uncharacterized protein LOC112088211 [Eutrema salsugineum]|uniref:uncharacterized protein LOC112088211 n=1 Tax=Eutrema salsugineum TaxID=72664 RepID=UPI000CED6F17|nr:uncharacterized protein LOC112088211 [Eutrema salsugineum]
MAAKPFLKMGLRKTIGSGLNTRVWSESWIPDLRARPPRAAPQIGFRDPGILVYSFIRQDTKQWDVPLLREFFQPEDVSLILGLRPSRTCCVATCQNLTYRHMGSDKRCLRCGDPEESINHLLFLCPPALQVWALSDFPSLPGVFPSTSIYQNMSFLFWKTKEQDMTDPQKDVYPWILWFIWKARNEKIFNGKESSPEDTLIHAKVEAESWRLANQPEDDDDAHVEALPPPSGPDITIRGTADPDMPD